MIFKTRSGSAYEIDPDTKQIRRLYGAIDPTPRTGTDGAWKKYFMVSDIVVGYSVFIHWVDEESDDDTIPGTITSHVAEILTPQTMS